MHFLRYVRRRDSVSSRGRGGVGLTGWRALIAGAALLVAAPNPRHAAFAPPTARRVRTQVADYRIGYLPAPERATEYAWTAHHYDRIVLDWGDAVSMPQYRRLNTGAQIERYALSWTVIQPTSPTAANIAATYYPDLVSWYASHPQHQLERAFLHRAGCSGGAGCRVSFHLWKDDRWALNPGDAGLRAYQVSRLMRVAADADGLFLDEHGSGDFEPLFKAQSMEYPSRVVYERDIVTMLRDIRAALAPRKHVIINTATYVTEWDAEMVRAAGGSNGEHFNDAIFPEMERRWAFAEANLAAGASMAIGHAADPAAGFGAGNYASPLERQRMWELASYYLIAPVNPGALYLNPNGSAWSRPFATTWFGALDVDIGAARPRERGGAGPSRRVQAEGVDGAGQQYRVWSRDYSNALVLVRPLIAWPGKRTGDETAVSVALPQGAQYRLLRGAGQAGPALSSILLRGAEAAILMKISDPVGRR